METVTLALGLARRFGLTRLVGRLLGNNAETIAEHVVGVATQVTGVTDPVQAAEAIQTNVAFEAAFRQQAAELDAELEQAYLADRQDARSRDEAFLAAGRHNVRADVLAYATVGGLLVVLLILFLLQIPEGPNRDIIMLLLGALVAMSKDVMSFEFGSSRGSKYKDLRDERRERSDSD